jgi:diguanylate cyclase (GGDEF)-like protein
MQAEQYVFRAFRQAEGLKNLSINSLQTGNRGFLWMGTENGVYRFLGSGFERFGEKQGIAELDIRDIIRDSNGIIWVASQGNLYHWDGQQFHPAGRNPILVDNQRRIVIEDARHLLVVEKGSLYRLEHDASGKMVSYLPVFSNSMLAAKPDLAHLNGLSVVNEPGKGQIIWAGCGNGLCSWQEKQAGNGAPTLSGTVNEWEMSTGLPADHWEGVLLDRNGTLWAGGFAHVAVLPPGSKRFVDRSIPGSDPQSQYEHAPLIEDPWGRVLVPYAGGIARWDGAVWRFIGQANGLERASHIKGMAFDSAGDLWFGSRGDGLYDWVGYGNWEGWSDQQGLLSISVWSITPYKEDRVLVGTELGPSWIDPRSGQTLPMTSLWKWPYGQIGGMAVSRDGSAMAGTDSGAILRIDPKSGKTKQVAKTPARIISALQDSSGRVYWGTVDGLYRQDSISPVTALQRVKAVDALLRENKRVQTGCQTPGGDLWFLGVNNQLVRFKNGAWTSPQIEGLSNPLRGELLGLSCATDGAIWVTGDLTGTWRLTPSGDRMKAWQLELPAELQSLAPLAIVADHRGWIWLGTDMGLVVWNGQNWRHLTQESGLIWNDVNQGAMKEASDGSMWIGTSGGVSHLMHPAQVFDPTPLTVSLTEFSRGETNYLGSRNITMPWAGPPLLIRISSPTMRNLSELVLKIKMEGYQPDWMITQTGSATFSRLPPGKFTFIAKACNAGLNICSEPVQVDITVLPPWWRTYWFYGINTLAILLLILAVHRLRVRQLRARSRHLESLVLERTRELEASREQLRIQATHDGLTGMLNRIAILRVFAAEMDRARRENRTVALALIDLDYFKQINDSYGHLAGDEALRWFAAAVGSAIRPYDHAGRYGGEEFLLVLTEIPREALEQRLTSLHRAITNLQVCERGAQFLLNCSMGATVFDPHEGQESIESLLAIADQALYTAKAEGRNRAVFRVPDYSTPHSAAFAVPTSPS